MKNEKPNNLVLVFFQDFFFPLLLCQNHLGLSTARNKIDMTKRWITTLINQQGDCFPLSEVSSLLFSSERRNDMRVNNEALKY